MKLSADFLLHRDVLDCLPVETAKLPGDGGEERAECVVAGGQSLEHRENPWESELRWSPVAPAAGVHW